MTFPPLQVTIPRVGHEVERRVLPNGAILYLAEDRSLPVLDVSVVFRAGSLYEATAQPGVVQFTASQLRNGGTMRLPAAALNEELEVLGASIEASASTEAISLTLNALAKDTDQALQLFTEVIRHPAFNPNPLQTAKGRVMEDLRRVTDSPSQLLAREFTRKLYTEAHPLGRPLTPAQVDAIQPDDLRAHHRRFFHPNNMMLAIVGDFSRDEMASKIQALFGDWPRGALDLPPLPEVQPRYERGVYVIPKNLAQASLALGHFGINRFNPDRYAIELMDYILGGSGFTSRIMERVRSEEGLAYSVGTSFPTGTRDLSLFRATAQTKNENVPRAVAAILEEMVRIQRQPVSWEELDRAQEAIINSFVFRFTSRFGTVVQLLTLEFNGYPPDYFETLLDRYRAITVADIHRVAQQYLRPDAATILIVGDPSKFESAMAAFGPVHRLPVDTPG
ncbi:MAG: insulinase family protein [candidate division NC10 bacterium]|nr:insulinase family protein [candidate division NC10 bacterium]